MANLTIRNVDDAVVERWKQRARDNNRSLEAELRHLLTAELDSRFGPSLRDLADRIAALSKGVKQTDSGILQAEGREELERRAER